MQIIYSEQHCSIISACWWQCTCVDAEQSTSTSCEYCWTHFTGNG